MMYESLIRNLILEHGNAFPHIERSFFLETADKKKALEGGNRAEVHSVRRSSFDMEWLREGRRPMVAYNAVAANAPSRA